MGLPYYLFLFYFIVYELLSWIPDAIAVSINCSRANELQGEFTGSTLSYFLTDGSETILVNTTKTLGSVGIYPIKLGQIFSYKSNAVLSVPRSEKEIFINISCVGCKFVNCSVDMNGTNKFFSEVNRSDISSCHFVISTLSIVGQPSTCNQSDYIKFKSLTFLEILDSFLNSSNLNMLTWTRIGLINRRSHLQSENVTLRVKLQSQSGFINPYVRSMESLVDAGDTFTINVTLQNINTTQTAYQLHLTFNLTKDLSFNNLSCQDYTRNLTFQTKNNTLSIFISLLKANSSVFCIISSKVNEHVLSGTPRNINFELLYDIQGNLHQSKQRIKHLGVVLMRTTPVQVLMKTTLNNTNLIAGQRVILFTVLKIPEGLSVINLKWTLGEPSRTRRSIFPYVPIAVFAVDNFTLNGSQFLTFNGSADATLENNTTVFLSLGKVGNPANVKKNLSSGELIVLFHIEIIGNPVLVSGRSLQVKVSLENGQTKTMTLSVIGPIVSPSLSISKIVKVLDRSSSLHTVQVAINIEHSSNSTYDAQDIEVQDMVTGMRVGNLHTIPTATGKSMLIGNVDKFEILLSGFSLRVGKTVTVIYDATFSFGSLVTVSESKATVKWKSQQLNSPMFGPISSASVCLKKKIVEVIKYEKNYWFVALGVFLGFLLGPLITLLLLACFRKTVLARKYILIGYSPKSDEEVPKEEKIGAKELVKKLRSEDPQIFHSWRYVALEEGLFQAENSLFGEIIKEICKVLLAFNEAKAKLFGSFLEKYFHLLHMKGDISLEIHKKVIIERDAFIKAISERNKEFQERIEQAAVTAETRDDILDWVCTTSSSFLDKGNSIIAELAKSARMNTGERKSLHDDFQFFMTEFNQEMMELKFTGIVFLESVHVYQLSHLHLYVSFLHDVNDITQWMIKKIRRECDVLLRRRLLSADVVTKLQGCLDEAVFDAEKEYVVEAFNILKDIETRYLPAIRQVLSYESLLDLPLLVTSKGTTADTSENSAAVAGIWSKIRDQILNLESNINEKKEAFLCMESEMIMTILVKLAESRDNILQSLLSRIKQEINAYFIKLSEEEETETVAANETTVIAVITEEDSLCEKSSPLRGKDDLMEFMDEISLSVSNLKNGRETRIEKEMDTLKVLLEDALRDLQSRRECYKQNQGELVLNGKIFMKIALCSVPYLSKSTAEYVINHFLASVLKTFEGSYLLHKWTCFTTQINKATMASTEGDENAILSQSMAFSVSKNLEDFIFYEFERKRRALEATVKMVTESHKNLFGYHQVGLQDSFKTLITFVRDSYKEDISKVTQLSQQLLITAETVGKMTKADVESSIIPNQESKDSRTRFQKALSQLQKPNDDEQVPLKEKPLVEVLETVISKCKTLFAYNENVDLTKMIINEDYLRTRLDFIEKQTYQLETLKKTIQSSQCENIQLLSDSYKHGNLDSKIALELIRDSVLYQTINDTQQLTEKVLGTSERDYVQEMIKYVTTSNAIKPAVVLTPSEVKVRKRKGKSILSKKKNSVLPASYPELPPLRGTRNKGFNLKEALS